MENNEDWFDIPEFEGIYQANPNGTFRNVKNNKIIKPSNGYKGYQVLKLYHGHGKCKQLLVHRVLAGMFIPKPDEKYTVVHHKDGNKKNNSIFNLEWTTIGRNVGMAWGAGLNNCRGEKNGRAILKEDDVRQIRKIYKEGHLIKNIALLYNMSQNAISCIVNNKTWKEVI